MQLPLDKHRRNGAASNAIIESRNKGIRLKNPIDTLIKLRVSDPVAPGNRRSMDIMADVQTNALARIIK